jgi:hypothetical protein
MQADVNPWEKPHSGLRQTFITGKMQVYLRAELFLILRKTSLACHVDMLVNLFWGEGSLFNSAYVKLSTQAIRNTSTTR